MNRYMSKLKRFEIVILLTKYLGRLADLRRWCRAFHFRSIFPKLFVTRIFGVKEMEAGKNFLSVAKFFPVLLPFLFFSCGSDEEQQDVSLTSAVLVNEAARERWMREIPAFRIYWEEIHQRLASPFPVLSLQPDEMDEQGRLAQQLALQNKQFVRDLFEPQSGQPLHSEVMRAAPLSQEVLTRNRLNCREGSCYEVQLYNFFFNHTTTAWVDVSSRQVLNVSVKSGARATNERLKRLAREVVLHTPAVLEALAVKPAVAKNLNSAVLPARCERSRHLGLAPVFEHGGRLLWVLVDATDWKVVGYKWMNGRLSDWQAKVAPISERTIQTEAVMSNFCEQSHDLQRDDWSMEYVLQPSDGLELKNLRYKDRQVLLSSKLVDWHVSYTFKKGFGYSDAVGCPQFSSAAVVAFRGPKVEAILSDGGDTLGFALVQDFRSPVWPLNCNYRYENRYEFYRDGRFRIAGVNHGLGCGVTGWYRPVFRIDLGEGGVERMQRYEAKAWRTLEREAWHLQEKQTEYSPEGYLYKWYLSERSGYYLEPGRGQFGDGGRGDHAYSYVCLCKPEEGEEDMTTFGPCCQEDERQGPEQFLQPAEPLAGKDLVLWYVPQMSNDNRPGQEYCWAAVIVEDGRQKDISWPGTVGPMFVPFSE